MKNKEYTLAKMKRLSRELNAFIAELERDAKEPIQGTAGLAALVDKYAKLQHEFESEVRS